MNLRKIFKLIYSYSLLIALSRCSNDQSKGTLLDEKTQVVTLEQKWLTAEFALDTAHLSSLMDKSFIGISEEGVHSKSEALLGMHKNISQRIRDSIFVDSFRIEDPIVNIYQNSAIVVFSVHTFRKDRGVKTEHKTRFYDVWIKHDNAWKAVASQGTKIE